MDFSLDKIILVAILNLCTPTSSSLGHVDLIVKFLATVKDLNADFVLVPDQRNDCTEFEDALNTHSPGSMLNCLKSEWDKYRVTSLQSRHIGIIFTRMIALNSTELEKVGEFLNYYRAEFKTFNPFVFLTTMENLDNGSSSVQLMSIAKDFPRQSFLLDSDVYVISYTTQAMYEIYIRRELLILRKVEPRADGNYFLNDKVRRRSNLMRSHVIVTTVNDSTYLNWVNMSSTKELVSGFSVKIYRDLQYMLNFTSRVVIGDWIYNDKDGALQGETYRQLSSGEADIAIAQQALLSYRAKYIQFLQPTYQGISQAFFQQPDTSAIRNIVTAPFKTTLWLCLGVTWLIVIFSVKLLLRLRRYHSLGETRMDNAFAADAFMWAVAASCQKSWYVHPTSVILKMAFLIGYLKGVVCYVAYSAAIVSALTVAIIPVKEFTDLISFKYVFTVYNLSYSAIYALEEMIKREKLSQKVEKVNNDNEISHLLLANPKYAFMSSSDTFFNTAFAHPKNYTKHFLCSYISKVPVSNVPLKSGFFLRKGSELTEVMNYKIIKMKERGLNFRYMKYYDKITGLQCESRDKSIDFGLGIQDVFTAFLIIIIGSAITLGLIFLEILYSRSHQNNWAHQM